MMTKKTMMKRKKKNNRWLVEKFEQNSLRKRVFLSFQDEFFAPVPSEIVDRLVTRPEDMSPDVADSIKTYRDQLLRSFEVNFLFIDLTFCNLSIFRNTWRVYLNPI